MTLPRLPIGLIERLGALGRVAELEATTGGAANLTLIARLDGAQVAVKVGVGDERRACVRREATLLPLLREAHLPVAGLLAFVDEPEPGFTFLVMDRLPGANGLDALQVRPLDVEVVVERARALGRLARLVHSTTIASVADPEGQFDLVAQLTRSQPEPVPTVLLNHPVALVHGDLGFHNTLWSERRCTGLLDWEVAGFGPPLVDLAWAWWTFAFRSLPPEAWPAYVEGYGARAIRALGWTPEVVPAVVACLMRRWRPGAPEAWDARLAALAGLPVPGPTGVFM